MKDPDRPMSREASVKTPILPPTPKTPGSEDPPVMLTPGIPGPGAPMNWGQDQMMHMYGRGEHSGVLYSDYVVDKCLVTTQMGGIHISHCRVLFLFIVVV